MSRPSEKRATPLWMTVVGVGLTTAAFNAIALVVARDIVFVNLWTAPSVDLTSSGWMTVGFVSGVQVLIVTWMDAKGEPPRGSASVGIVLAGMLAVALLTWFFAPGR